MKSILVHLLLLSSLSSMLFAQSEIAQLQLKIGEAQEDSTRLQLQEQLLKTYTSTGQLDSTLSFSSRLYELYKSQNNKKGLQMAILFKAIILNHKGQSAEAAALCKEGAKLCFEIGDSLQAAKHLTNMGVFYQVQAQDDEALVAFLQAYPIFQQKAAIKLLSRVLNNIAIIYRRQEEYEKAIAIYQQSLAIRESLNDSTGVANTFMNMGVLYSFAKQMDTAETYLLKAIDSYKTLGIEEDLINCYNALGNVYFNLKCYNEALPYLNEANTYYQQHPSPWYQTSNTFALGSIYFEQENFQLAETFFEEAVALGKQANRWGDQQELFLNLSKSKYALNKHQEGYLHLLTAYENLDAVREERRLALMEENLARFEVLQKEKKLAVNELELERRTRQRNNLLTGLLILLLIGSSLLFFFRQRILIANQKAELQQQHIHQLQQEKKLTALHAIIEGEEQERNRIAADLHDGLGGLLTSVKSHYTQLLKKGKDVQLHQKTSQLIDDACAEVRRISYNMSPRALTISGLQGAIEDLCLLIKSQGLDCELEVIGLDEQQLEKQAVHLYRIVQELTNNVIKHAEAQHLFVQLFQKDGFLSILVEDDGKGFATDANHTQKGLGLSSVESRVKAMNGEVHWYSEEGAGTSVSMRFKL